MSLVIAIVTILLLLCSVASIFQWPHGSLRSLEFPRVQIFVISVMTAFGLTLTGVDTPTALFILAALLCACAIQLSYIIRFTPIWPKKAAWAAENFNESRFQILIANVEQSNRNYGLVSETIEEQQPDIVVLTEVDKGWKDALQPVAQKYPYSMDCPLDNSFGMMLLSRYPVVSEQLDGIGHW